MTDTLSISSAKNSLSKEEIINSLKVFNMRKSKDQEDTGLKNALIGLIQKADLDEYAHLHNCTIIDGSGYDFSANWSFAMHLIGKRNYDAKVIILWKEPLEEIVWEEIIDCYQWGRMPKVSKNWTFQEMQWVFSNIKYIQLNAELKENLKKTRFEGLKASSDAIQWHVYINQQALWQILHSLAPTKVEDPYTPKDEREKDFIQEAFTFTKEYFPGLDTIEKMLDFVLNVKLDIPEKMKGKYIQGVYCDTDGTLLNKNQELNQETVNLLKSYEVQWKEIHIRTGGDRAEKEIQLRKLGIVWPVYSKYEYAWAIAEIVIDDLDKEAFILQSKILPQTFMQVK
jgi:hypothetical protein